MRASRETVIAALVAKLTATVFASPVNGKTTFATVSRKLKLFSDVPPQARPALFVTEHHETSSFQSENTPVKLSMDLNLFIYTNSRAATVPATDLNVILDAIDAALAPNCTGRQDLGGNVSHCRIEGQVMKDPGDIDGDGFLWIPIKILGP